MPGKPVANCLTGTWGNLKESFPFQQLTTIQCSIPPLNPDFAPFIAFCVSSAYGLNRILPSRKRERSIRPLRVRARQVFPGSTQGSVAMSAVVPAIESERTCISQ
jgi:hypothetical protein